ncbi:MATE family efflux transporter [Lacrimispora sp. 210928-DFI.3.58]|uniref:MATE family efflux transporter n=1 Tax=Lacrimispora sp. 210928-DFI.3.58 TaxID=2883214 RepID=UPI001D098D81|nr:MATE family efflux transporter [Lacrimispora sp. 210928-DFI.3.58]MCB7318660.1 MATE family efflux transporter [Lacrimispora sp. 210928-DFI.3.58]
MAKQTVRDMTEGSPFQLILAFFIPMLCGMLFQQLYSMVDTIIVGKCLGVGALAAVGATGSLSFMIIGFCQGVCSGFSIPVAQKFGEKNEKALRRFVANSGWLAALFSLVMTTVVCSLCHSLLVWMNTPEDIIEGAYQYIFVVFLGIPATYLYNLLSGIIRSLGDSTTPLVFLVLSSLLNVALDFFTILVLDMGVAGAGWATIISQAVSGILCLIYMRKKFTILRMEGDEWKPNRRFMAALCGMGIPMGLQYSITAIGSVVLQTAVNALGSMAVAAVTAGNKIVMFACCPFDALGATMATYGGQNVGAKRLDRVDQGLKVGTAIGCIYAIGILAVLWLFGSGIALLFVDAGEKEILANTQLYVLINAALFIPLVIVNNFRFMIQGLGYSKFAVIAGVCEMAARASVGFFLVPVFGYVACCFASPAAWVAADLFLIPAYRHVIKSLQKLFGDAPGKNEKKYWKTERIVL